MYKHICTKCGDIFETNNRNSKRRLCHRCIKIKRVKDDINSKMKDALNLINKQYVKFKSTNFAIEALHLRAMVNRNDMSKKDMVEEIARMSMK